MLKTPVNPYLPGWEYVPDGEPHVFEGRLYVFGSHDRAHGTAFCQDDYVAWSAPEDDLSDWRYEGIIYKKDQDPHNSQGQKELWAPDVCRGTDGRYYLYYALAFVPEIGIAVSESPGGPYEFYGHLQTEEGVLWQADLPFDPGILFEDEDHIWLHTGFGSDPIPNIPMEVLLQQPEFQDLDEIETEKMKEQIELLHNPSEHCSCLKLAKDMKTVLSSSAVLPVHHNAAGTDFEEHPFFEASSIRKIKDTYYLVYSSFQGHELCYATSKFPDKDFTFGGVIISNGDIGFQGNKRPKAYMGNNHGGIVQVGNQWYVFYHRHTNGTQFSRQGCAEKITIDENGNIEQVEMTSLGLGGDWLPANERYSAHICCNLEGPKGASFINMQTGLHENEPYITEENTGTEKVNQYISNLRAGAHAGVKYLNFSGEDTLSVMLRGEGSINIFLDETEPLFLSSVSVDIDTWNEVRCNFAPVLGKHSVWFKCSGTEKGIDFSDFKFNKKKES